MLFKSDITTEAKEVIFSSNNTKINHPSLFS